MSNCAAAVTNETSLRASGIPTDRGRGARRVDVQDALEPVGAIEDIHSEIIATSDKIPATRRELHKRNGIGVLAAESLDLFVGCGVEFVS